jgi:hypothetical protein
VWITAVFPAEHDSGFRHCGMCRQDGLDFA